MNGIIPACRRRRRCNERCAHEGKADASHMPVVRHRGEEAARLYLSLLPESRIKPMHRADPEGPVPVVEFTLAVLPGWLQTAAPAAS